MTHITRKYQKGNTTIIEYDTDKKRVVLGGYLTEENKKIFSIERNIDFYAFNAIQIAYDDLGLITRKNAVKQALRHEPDIILVEMPKMYALTEGQFEELKELKKIFDTTFLPKNRKDITYWNWCEELGDLIGSIEEENAIEVTDEALEAMHKYNYLF